MGVLFGWFGTEVFVLEFDCSVFRAIFVFYVVLGRGGRGRWESCYVCFCYVMFETFCHTTLFRF